MIIYLLLLFIALVVIYLYFINRFEVVKIGKYVYKVEKTNDDNRKQQAIKTLVEVRKKLLTLVDVMVKTFPTDPKIARMKKRFSDTVFQEANPEEQSLKEGMTPSKPSTSYTLNKGDVMVLCIRNVDGSMVDINTLMYVSIHELAHILSSSLNHTPEFWENMKLLIDYAIKNKIYIKRDYSNQPVPYCGITIDSNVS
jgi:hypothetical protein